VSSALSKCRGKGVKQRGDVIMASFSTTSNAVAAAIDMQRDTAKHNMVTPDLRLGLKIGLDTGEPIVEENDLYGSTVQLAARIVDKAQEAQIFVSETVYGICSGKNFEFEKRGPFEMKGFADGLALHELIWNPDAPRPNLTRKAPAFRAPSKTPETSGEEAEGQETKDQKKEGKETKSNTVVPDEQIVIFISDIADYDSLLGKNKETSNARIAGALEYAGESIKAKRGDVLRQDGDVIFSMFPNAVDAVKAAVTIQTKLHELNKKMSKSQQVHFRIGILFGHAKEDSSKISDDDMDVATSLNSKAQPGGLCVMADIVEQLGDKADIAFKEGDDEPVHLYRWQPD